MVWSIIQIRQKVEVRGDRLNQQVARAGFAFGIEITVSVLR